MKKSKHFDISDYEMCENCIHGSKLSESDLMMCKKHGLKNPDESCRHFKMDLLAIRPKKLRTFTTTLSEEDFKL
ncbi:MAG: hypothetical protein Q4G23_09615 [Clostridia bacterium]|nr:hypothetical protein [Clostridia bacterium]